MKSLKWFVILFMAGCVGCAAAPVEEEEPPVFVEAEREEEEPPPPRVVRVPVVQAAPGQARPAPPAQEVTQEQIEEAIERSRERPWEVIDEANEQGRAYPVEDGFYNAIQVYDYAPGVLYQVYTAAGRLTSIEFQPGEQIRSVGLGDTVRWVVGQTESGQGGDQRELVLVKPVRSGLTTNAVITTNRRTYQLELRSYRDSYMASVSWAYPGADILRFGGGDVVEESPRPDTEQPQVERDGLAVGVGALNFEYGFKVDNPRRPPAWMPVRVFDDGRKTFIQFSEEVRERELPAFFILSRTGRPVVANYRVRGDYIIVDQVFDLAMLRLAEAEMDGETVGIERLEQGSRR